MQGRLSWATGRGDGVRHQESSVWAGQERVRSGPQAVLSSPPTPPQLRSGEKIKLIPLLCIVCTSVVWGFALFFFFQGLSTWQVSGPQLGAGSHP